MSIEDDLVEQERWERNSAAYKRTHPAPCPELVREKQSKMCAEKDAMIDWLATVLAKYGAREQRWRRPGGQQVSEFDVINQPQYWIDKARQEVKKND